MNSYDPVTAFKEMMNYAVGGGMLLLCAYLLMLTLAAGNLIATAASAIHCVTKGKSENKIGWLIIIIAFPAIGWICYWILNRRPSEGSPIDSYRDYIPPPPAPKSSKDIADEITAEIEASVRNRRAGR